MRTAILAPRPGAMVYMPTGGYLPPEGERVEVSTYWLRRLADGLVFEVRPVEPAEEKQIEAVAKPKRRTHREEGQS